MELVTVKNAATLWQLLTPAYACLPHDMRCLLPKSGFSKKSQLEKSFARQALTVLSIFGILRHD